MGAAAARRLASQGFETLLWNRTRERAETVGVGVVMETAREAAAQ
ncbi:MAG: NAD(P)-binding domain-containing protein, partial [Candidatus Dormibacteraeota bacterium]|nr:NAD(P)-binding domain-containing protein [Candidatus Dormibacteraeota bacterium]